MLRVKMIGAGALVWALALGAGPAAAQQGEQPAEKPGQKQPEKPKQPGKEADKEAKWEIGKPAKAFELTDVSGQKHTLAQHKGDVVVLVWWNPTCDEVRHQFQQGSLMTLPKEFQGQPVTWLAINSTPQDEEGGGAAATIEGQRELGMTMPVLLDLDARTAKAYDVKKAPTVFVIDQEGTLVYAGAVDNAPKGKPEGSITKETYLRDAITATLGGTTLTTETTKVHGCPIKAKDAD